MPRYQPQMARPASRVGFTLVELAVAMFVIGVALVGSAALVSTSLRYQRGAATRDEMITLADAKLDELRSYQLAPSGTALWAKLATGGSLTTSVNGYSDTPTIPGGKSYRRRWHIVASTAGTRQVTVRIEPAFSDRYATGRVELRTLVAPQ
jgi:prepilin-type N-terminal cleavage/methylation domain-containing protein